MNETMNLIYDVWETVTTNAAGCTCRIWGEVTVVVEALVIEKKVSSKNQP